MGSSDRNKNQFGRVHKRVSMDKRLSASAVRLYTLLANYADKNGRCYPTIRRLEEELPMSHETLLSAKNNLIDCGYLVVEKAQRDSGRFGNNIYTLLLLAKKTPPWSENQTTVNTTNNGRDTIPPQSVQPQSVQPTTEIQTTNIPSSDIPSSNIPDCFKRESFAREGVKSEKEFIPPSLEEVTAYCEERHSSVNPKTFFDYYSASNWIDSRGFPVRNWKQRVIAWEADEENGKRKPKKSKASSKKPHVFVPTKFDEDEKPSKVSGFRYDN